jgi:glyoxylase-like metal-dependent hydrolase (beta-lactamase superfamily II)
MERVMTFFICETCGTQFTATEGAPESCAICLDERQYVGWGGQRWTTHEALAARHAVLAEADDGLLGLRMSPSFAIDQRALVLSTASRRVLWESLSLVTPEAVAAATAAGPIDFIAISHPHFYSSMVEWSDALGGVPIYLHEADRQWVQRPSSRIVFWRGDEHVVAPGVTLIRCGGHFEGSTALHWRDAARPAGALFPGDALQVVADRRHVSFMYSYPNHIPMHPDAVRAMRRRLKRFEFADVYGFSRGRNIIGGGRAAVDRSFDRYLGAVGAARMIDRGAKYSDIVRGAIGP